MKDISTIPHHPAIEEIAEILVNKTQNQDIKFMRVMVAYFIGKLASNMRVQVMTKDRGSIPVNVYTLSLAVSGSGKGHSVGILENEIMNGFQDRFMGETFPRIADAHLARLSLKRAQQNGTDSTEELESLRTEFSNAGPLAFTFDGGTEAAIKQMRHKLLLADIGAINLQVDEIGNNLMGRQEVLNIFLELYDQGSIKQKLTKNTSENKRNVEVTGKTPANMLLFGTPSALLDGSKTEEEFNKFLETGYARRCFFAFGQRIRASETKSPEEIYHLLTQQTNSTTLTKWSQHFVSLANPMSYNWKIDVPDDVGIALLTYKINCEQMADKLPEHEEVLKAEITHRYYKALKLAGALAFVDQTHVLTEETLMQAIKLTEESGDAFGRIFTRDKNYARLAKFIASNKTEVTHADLTESLPFYKGSQSARNEMMTLAIAWGYKNNIIIRKTFVSSIEFYSGETLERTNLNEMILSFSNHIADGYRNTVQPFDKLHKLMQLPDYHWINHRLKDGDTGAGHRCEDDVIQGFNMIVIDVDNGTSIESARDLLKDYQYLIYTTKRHTDAENRFRIVLPISYKLNLDGEDFKEFMDNVYAWLPFNGADKQTGQRARKWATHDGEVFENEGELLDPLQFIPKTSKNEEFQKGLTELGSMDNVERWFAQRMQHGSRNNHMLRFAMMMADSGMDHAEAVRRVVEFNEKLSSKLELAELRSTVLVTLAKRYQNSP